MDIEVARLDQVEVVRLVTEVQADYVLRYGGQDRSVIDPESFVPPNGLFLLGRIGGSSVAMGGYRRHDAVSAEVKRMYVRARWRRRGLSLMLLNLLEREAAAVGYRRLVLFTGLRQPEALELYGGAGYRPTEPWGRYANSELARFFVKDLPPGQR